MLKPNLDVFPEYTSGHIAINGEIFCFDVESGSTIFCFLRKTSMVGSLCGLFKLECWLAVICYCNQTEHLVSQGQNFKDNHVVKEFSDGGQIKCMRFMNGHFPPHAFKAYNPQSF